MDSFEQNAFYCSREDIESFKPTTKPIELRANEFAAEFLMPRFIYKPLTATAIRFMDLTDEACCLIVSQAGRIAWFRKSRDFRPYVQMDNRLLSPGTVAYAIFQGNIPPVCFEDGRQLGIRPGRQAIH
ncbi:MAG: hypothetical protein JRJ77_11970 [Deltaproteobacteria bacterium]|nr:hypothetical protein [Deltaproteobacteria bacterium]